jgi:hypothetical protein
MRIAALAIGLALAAPAAAQQLYMEVDRSYLHFATGLRLPDAIADLPRGPVREEAGGFRVHYGDEGATVLRGAVTVEATRKAGERPMDCEAVWRSVAGAERLIAEHEPGFAWRARPTALLCRATHGDPLFPQEMLYAREDDWHILVRSVPSMDGLPAPRLRSAIESAVFARR